jgi:hypothetical protein
MIIKLVYRFIAVGGFILGLRFAVASNVAGSAGSFSRGVMSSTFGVSGWATLCYMGLLSISPLHVSPGVRATSNLPTQPPPIGRGMLRGAFESRGALPNKPPLAQSYTHMPLGASLFQTHIEQLTLTLKR